MVKLKLVPFGPRIGELVASRLILETLPAVNPNGIYAPGAPLNCQGGVTNILTDRLVSSTVAPVPAECVYVDPNAMKKYGLGDLLSKGPFPVDAEFIKRLTHQFALRRVDDTAGSGGDSQELISSRYAQTERNKGDARGGYISRNNPDGSTSTLFVKGVGRTPCCDPEHAQAGHTDGYVSTHSSIAESVWPSVFQNLFTHTTPGTIGFFGIDTFGREFDSRIGHEEQAVILLRGGQMLRPAHFVEQGVYDRYMQFAAAQQAAYPTDWSEMPRRALSESISLDGLMGTMPPEYFFRAAHATGVMRYRTDLRYGDVPDMQATFVEILDRFSLTAAESWTWRWMQSAPSAGNAEISGGLIDVETASSNPRTGRMYVLSYSLPFGHPEFTWRVVAVKMMWESLVLNLTPQERELYNVGEFNFAQIYARSYNEHLRHQYLKATGLKDEVVQNLMNNSPDDVSKLSEVLHALSTMENGGPIPYTMTKEGQILEDADRIVAAKSVVDVFGFLGKWSKTYFDAVARGEKPSLDEAMQALNPIYGEGNPETRSAQELNVQQLTHDLTTVYDRLMQSAIRSGVQFYDGVQPMRNEIVARAAFRNKPMDELYYWRLRRQIIDKVGEVDPATGHTVLAQRRHLWPTVHRKVELSVRNADALLRDRDVVVHGDRMVDVGVTMYGNTTYGVHADPMSGAREVFVRVPVGDPSVSPFLNMMGDETSVSSLDGARLLYRMTENNVVVNEGVHEAQRVVIGGHTYLNFALPVGISRYGVLEGVLEVGGKTVPLFEYAYASPDNATVRQLAHRSK